MKKTMIILAITLAGALAFGHAQEDVDTVIADDLAQYGASGYLTAPVVNECTEDEWEPLIGSDLFTVTFVSGFSFVADSTVEYDNGPRVFDFSGNVSATNDESQGCIIEFGLELNGVYVAGSTSGPRDLGAGESCSVSYGAAIELSDGDQIGLVTRVTSSTPTENTITFNVWRSNAARY